MTLRKLLGNATGEPEHVVAVNVDIRGFSAFCEKNESHNVVLFIREAYKKLIDRYFADVPFVKTTGDGLLLISPYTKDNVEQAATETLNACMKAHEDFSSFFDGDPMVVFTVPSKIGIGVSRGAVSKIVANGETVDYSGRVLNLASRLMNLARPSGIVFDTAFVKGLPPVDQTIFSKSSVWLFGLAESEPIEVYYSEKYGTKIPSMYTRPLDVLKWGILRDARRR